MGRIVAPVRLKYVAAKSPAGIKSSEQKKRQNENVNSHLPVYGESKVCEAGDRKFLPIPIHYTIY